MPIIITKVLASMPSIRTYVKKNLFTDKFMKAIKNLPHQENVHLKNGATLWSDKNLRIDYGNNSDSSKEIHFNLQKNKGSKLDGLKNLSTHDKILSMKVYKDKAVDEDEVTEVITDAF